MTKHIRKLTVTGKGRTYYLTLPLEVIRALGWKKGERKTIEKDGDKIIIRDWER